MSNLKISQLEKITNMKEDSFVLAVQNGKNYKMSVKEAMNSYIDLSNYYTKEETVDKINDCIETFEVTTIPELQTSITSNTDLINTTKIELQTSITSNTNLINTTKTELIGTENTDGTTIWGAKKYADEKAATAKAAADAAQVAADAAQSTANTAKANAATADGKAVAAQNTADELKNTTIPALKTSLEGKITSNTTLITTTKAELVGTEGQDGTTIYGAKKHADDLADGLSKRIDSIVAGGVAFKGVVSALPSTPKNGDLVIIGKEGGIKVGDITYKKDYEYIYSDGAWYELGDSDKNAKAIAAVETKVNANTTAISDMDTAYKAADTTIKQSIETLSNAAVKSIAGGKSTYVTVSASAKDETGKVTLTVSDTIATTFDTQASVDGKISAAKDVLIGTEGIAGNTIWGAKNYAMGLVQTLENSFVAITDEEINGLFTV